MDIALHDILGSFGSILIATAYLLIQIEYWRADDLLFSAINAVGAAMIFYSLTQNFHLAAILMEGFWILISLYGIWKYYHQKKSNPASDQSRLSVSRPKS